MTMARAHYGGCPGFFLLAGGNWNNARNAGPSYRNANNTPSNSNRNIGTHVEPRSRLSGPEQRTCLSPGTAVAKHTTDPQRGASTGREAVGRSPLSVGLEAAA